MLVEIRLHPAFNSPVPPTPSRWISCMVICRYMCVPFPFFFAILATSVLLPAAPATTPWDAPFSGNTGAILEESRRVPVPDSQGAIVLLEDHKYTIDRNSRTTTTIRKVFRILQQDAVEDWSSIEHEYAPWYENRPEFRARVIRADGSVHWLDPKTIADAPAQEFDSTIFSDRRAVRAPLPAVAAGAVVEYEIVIR